MHQSEDIKARQPISFDDDLHFYKARIYKPAEKKDNRIQVRPIPHLIQVKEPSELEHLPRYPTLFAGQLINGKTETEDGKDNADIVVILSTPDFQYGYVVGLLGEFDGIIKQSPAKTLIPFHETKRYITRRGLKPKHFDIENIVVQASCFTKEYKNGPGGGFIEFYNFRTGEKFILLGSGTFFTMMNDRIVMRVGSPNESGSVDAFSQMTMTNHKVFFQAKGGVIEFDAPHLILGHHGHVAVSTIGQYMSTAVDGMEITGTGTIAI